MPSYKANFNYFDKINTPDKAYWLGFIWADGYIAKRVRTQPSGHVRIEYNLKLALQESDASHIQKFLDCIESNYPVHFYKSKGFNREPYVEARTFITNLHLGYLLYEKYGIIPRRFNISLVLEILPKEYEKYFILGVFDADGSFTTYQGDYGKKMTAIFGGSEMLLRFIERHFIKQGIIEPIERKVAQRHQGKDGTWRTLNFSGVPQVSRILNYLYKDSPIYLERKYNKYLTINNLREKPIVLEGELSPVAKRVVCDGIEYISIKQCAEFYGVYPGNMRQWLRGERKMPQKFVSLGLSYL